MRVAIIKFSIFKYKLPLMRIETDHDDEEKEVKMRCAVKNMVIRCWHIVAVKLLAVLIH